MKIEIGSNEAGQRLDKFLRKLLKDVPLSAIFKAIHPFMPFTYSVDGFRKVISMSNVSLNTEIIVFVGIIIICSLLTILVYNHRIKKPTPLIPQAFENVNE